jgi:hypothetical protein
MKRAYIILAVILIGVIVAFVYAKSYINRLKVSDIELKHEISRKGLIDSLDQAYQQSLTDSTGDLRQRYEDLRDESNALLYALESQLDLYINQEYDPLLQMDSTAKAMPDSNEGTSRSDEPAIKPAEYEIYISYLENTLEFPGDLSSYEKAVEVSGLKKKLMAKYSVDKSELEQILIKVRKRGQ